MQRFNAYVQLKDSTKHTYEVEEASLDEAWCMVANNVVGWQRIFLTEKDSHGET